ncbi:hypothetical protein [Nocardiopsis gilva]|uniref:hypothetical protein n=1 Tax=Nocardiopsis gilva TaxID=280236 RepID=UPI00034CD174|nr:hypothetical protein [Nocardiopsis gilva]
MARRSRLVPEQAHAVDLVPRAFDAEEIDTPEQRDVAAAAARTAISHEIETRWPGAPYVIRQGKASEFEDLALGTQSDALVVFGVVYEFDD